MPREPWYDSDNPTRVARGASWRIGVWLVVAVIFVGAVSAGVWYFHVATSDIRGRGNATRQVNSADNRLFAQGHFNDLYQDILASDRKLDQAAADTAARPDDPIAATNYTGLKAHCEDTVAAYNSAARKITQAKFRDEDLPYQIDPADPKTDCKETAK